MSSTSQRPMSVHTGSAGLDPATLVPGRDLVLALDEAHGLDAAEGTVAHDLLDIDARAAVDRASTSSYAEWRRTFDLPLTVDGICLPHIWELIAHVDGWLTTIRDAAGLAAAVREYECDAIELRDLDPATERVARAVAERYGLPVAHAATAGPLPPAAPTPAAPASRRLVAAATRLGVPTVLRPGNVAFQSYWPMMPLLDAMLERDGAPPAIFFDRRPSGAKRSLRALRRGGMVGIPGPRDRRRARRLLAGALDGLGPPPPLEVLGLPLGPALHARALAMARRRGPTDLALGAVWRRAFGSGKVRTVIVAGDHDPANRLTVTLAQEAGVRTFLLQHGAVILPRPAMDMELSDEVAIWSPLITPPFDRGARPVHVVGYPIPHAPPPTRRLRTSASKPRVTVLGQGEDEMTVLMDARLRLRHYLAAVAALTAAAPNAEIVLRPHHWNAQGPLDEITRRFPTADIVIDRTSDIHELLAATDLCIGASTTATYQAALAGTPVIVLNLSGFDWPWPLERTSRLPVACSRAELETHVTSWAAGETLPGRDELLEALGAHGGDVTARLLELVDGRASGADAAAHPARLLTH